MFTFLFSSSHYQRMYNALEDIEISVKDIEDFGIV